MESELSAPFPGWAEADPDMWWENVTALVPQCIRSANVTADEIAAIGVSGMVPTVVLLDGEGRVLRPSIQQNDARAIEQIEALQSKTNHDEMLSYTGSAITQQSVGPKLLWIQQHEPEVWSKIEHVMGSYDYVNYRLTGEYSIEHNWALESGLYSLLTSDWLKEILTLTQVPHSWLGPVCHPSKVIGGITHDAARETGLAKGTPVVAGSADHVASAFSAGLQGQGQLLIKLGGAGDVLYVLNQLLVDERLYLDYHVIPDKFLLNGCMAASGSIIKWFQEQFAPEVSYAILDSHAADIAPGAQGLVLLPYFLGEKTPIHDPQARGVFAGLTLSHTRAHLYRAILEGISYGFLHHIEVIQSLGLQIERTRVTNGGSKSTLWPQITSDVLGVPLEHIADHPGSSLGAAFVAGMGVDLFHTWEEIERFLDITKITEPAEENTAFYKERYSLYRQLYELNKPLLHQISDIRR